MESYYTDTDEIVELREFISTHKAKLNDMKKAAEDKWGEYLK